MARFFVSMSANPQNWLPVQDTRPRSRLPACVRERAWGEAARLGGEGSTLSRRRDRGGGEGRTRTCGRRERREKAVETSTAPARQGGSCGARLASRSPAPPNASSSVPQARPKGPAAPRPPAARPQTPDGRAPTCVDLVLQEDRLRLHRLQLGLCNAPTPAAAGQAGPLLPLPPNPGPTGRGQAAPESDAARHVTSRRGAARR